MPSTFNEKSITLPVEKFLFLFFICFAELLYIKLPLRQNVRIWSYSGYSEYGEIFRISPYSVRMRGNKDQNNSEHGHFLHSVRDKFARHFIFLLVNGLFIVISVVKILNYIATVTVFHISSILKCLLLLMISWAFP